VVILYDVQAEGYHTPLTREQIAELFYAGRLTRDTPCKHAVKSIWRTVDELFPLLKYDSSAAWDSHKIHSQTPSDCIPLIAAGAVMLVIVIFVLIEFRHRQPEIAANTNRGDSTASAPVTSPASSSSSPAWNLDNRDAEVARERAQAEQQRLSREQLQREQAVRADQMRADIARQEREREKAAGTDFIVPLDETMPIPVGGLSVMVKVHDNDVTSIDAWINGNWRREIPKQKGISHSRTDETLLYSNGRASLYYVWEISGSLNNCVLRVREE
jgi:hypothetical protein